MKTFTLAISLALVVSTAPLAYAGPGHGHSHDHASPVKLDDKSLIAAASRGVAAIINQKQLVDGKSLDQAWGSTPDTEKSISKKGNGYSVVRFDSKTEKKALYVLLSSSGEIYDANFTGQFEGLED